MEKLPTALICLTAQHAIDQVDVMEQLLSENIEVEKCIPLVLKEAFNMPRIPDAFTTLKYLLTLWSDEFHQDSISVFATQQSRYFTAAARGLAYLLPYVDTNPDIYTSITALEYAASYGELETVKYILEPLLQGDRLTLITPNAIALLFGNALKSATTNSRVDVVAYLLSRIMEAVAKVPAIDVYLADPLSTALYDATSRGDYGIIKLILPIVKLLFSVTIAHRMVRGGIDRARMYQAATPAGLSTNYPKIIALLESALRP